MSEIKKWAKLKNGEVWQYMDFDDFLEAKYVSIGVRMGYEKYGKKLFPVLINDLGGYHSSYEGEIDYIIEADCVNMFSNPELFEDVINNFNYSYGWISDNGVFYPCDTFEHLALARDAVNIFYAEEYEGWKYKYYNAPDDFLLTKGWIHGTCSAYYYNPEDVTDKALATLEKVRKKK